MSEVNNSATKLIIDTVIERNKAVLKEDYEPREDLDFVDVFFPKLCAIYGAKICLAINEEVDIQELLLQRGLTKKDFDRIDGLMEKGLNFSNQNNNSLDKLFEIERALDYTLKSYAVRVRDKLSLENKKIDLEIIEKAIRDSFDSNPNIYTPCSVYETTIEKNVK